MLRPPARHYVGCRRELGLARLVAASEDEPTGVAIETSGQVHYDSVNNDQIMGSTSALEPREGLVATCEQCCAQDMSSSTMSYAVSMNSARPPVSRSSFRLSLPSAGRWHLSGRPKVATHEIKLAGRRRRPRCEPVKTGDQR